MHLFSPQQTKMFKWATLLFGLLFGVIDSVALTTIKNVHLGWSAWWMILPVALYTMNPFIFLKTMAAESLTIMNIVWDLSSVLIVTFIGLFWFKESVPPLKLVGICLSFISMFLMTYESNSMNEFLSNNVKKVVSAFVGSSK
jgi:multidrug transporter EmrE-like cation transporter